MAEGPITRFMCVLKPCGLFLHAFSQLAFFDLQARIFQIQYFVPRHKFALASLATIIIHAFALNGQRGELLFACSSHIRGALFIGTSNTITRAHHHCHHQHHYHHHYQYYKDRERESHSHQKKTKCMGLRGTHLTGCNMMTMLNCFSAKLIRKHSEVVRKMIQRTVFTPICSTGCYVCQC